VEELKKYDNLNDDEKANFIKKMKDNLAKIRKPFEAMVDNVALMVHPGRRLITDTGVSKGQKTGTKIYDGTAMNAASIYAEGVHGHLCSASIAWFKFEVPTKYNFGRISGMKAWNGKRLDEYPDVREYCETMEEAMYPAYRRSNFYTFNPESIREGATIGTATGFLQENVAAGRTVFTLPHFREVYIAENQFGEVDTWFREYNLTLSQMVEKFGIDKLIESDSNFINEFNTDPYKERPFINAIFPRERYNAGSMAGRDRPWASIWVQVQPLKLMLEDGFYDPPAVTWRFRKNNDEWYGRSLAWDAYCSIMSANQMGRTNIEAGQKMVDPAMVGPTDMRGRINRKPGAWNWVDAAMMQKELYPKPLVTGIQLPFGVEQQERLDAAIREHFHIDYFLMLNRAAMEKVELTAYQVAGMMGEQAAILGTKIGRLQTEWLDPEMDRMIAVEDRAGRLPDIPQIMLDLGQRIELDYLGPLAQAQKQIFEIQGLRTGLRIAADIVAIDQTAIDVLDGDAAMRKGLRAAAFPATAIRSPENVAKIRAIRQQQMEQERAMQQAIDVSKALPGAGKAIEKGSAADALMGGQG